MRQALKPLIEFSPSVMVGKPVIKGTRIPVERILKELAGGWSPEEVIEAHPSLTRDHIRAAIDYAADVLSNEEVLLSEETA